MGGTGVLVKLEQVPTDAGQLKALHKDIWDIVRARLGRTLKSRVTKDILVHYIDEAAQEGFEIDDRREETTYLRFSFSDGGGNCVVEMYAACHWVSKAISDVFDEAQAMARSYGAELTPRRWQPKTEESFFFIGRSLAYVNQHQLWIRSAQGTQAKDLDELPADDRARQLLAQKRCECELCLAGPHVSPHSAFRCVAGQLAPLRASGKFEGTTDGGTADGYSRGHYICTQPAEGDIDVTVTAERLTDDHHLPLEIAFRGGYFAVTGTSTYYLFEHSGNWTGWQPTPTQVGKGPMDLRLIQRGRRVSGYVNDTFAGSIVLDKDHVGPVAFFFQGTPGTVARARFQDFAVNPLTADPLDQPRSITFLARAIEHPDSFERLSLEERRTRDCLADCPSFPVRSGRFLDSFFRVATNSDFGVFHSQVFPLDDEGLLLDTSMIDHLTLADVVGKIAQLVEGNAPATEMALHAYGGGTANPARLSAALRQGVWPESGDAAEEAAAAAFHLLSQARRAVANKYGLCIEHRGALHLKGAPSATVPAVKTREPGAEPTDRLRSLETLLARIRVAGMFFLQYDMWDAHGRQHADAASITQMEADLVVARRAHSESKALLETLVATVRAEAPAEIAAWADAHDEYLTAFYAECIAKGDHDSTAAFVATRERQQWGEVRAGTRAYVEENVFYITLNAERYQRLFGIDPRTITLA